MPDAVLQIGGANLGGWKTLRVERSLAAMAGGFSLGFGGQEADGTTAHKSIQPGASCVLSLGNSTVLTGYVGETTTTVSANENGVTVKGWSKTRDLVDCCHTGKVTQWKNLNLLKIVGDVCEPFGISVVALADLGGPLAEVKYGPGDTVMSFVNRLCRLRGVMAMSLSDGSLALTKAGAKRAPASLEMPGNVISCSFTRDNSQRHSVYQVKGYNLAKEAVGLVFDGDAAEEALELLGRQNSPMAQAKDPYITRHRPLVIVGEQSGDKTSFENRAQWEATSRAGRSRTVQIVVEGWEAAKGGLWRPNQLARVSIPSLGIGEDMLIEGVAYSMTAQEGIVTSLDLVPPGAYAPEPAKPEKAGEIGLGLDFGL